MSTSFKKSFIKLLPKYLGVAENVSEKIHDKMLMNIFDSKVLLDNKEINKIFRSTIKEFSVEVPHQKGYEILSSIAGCKNYNVALSKEVSFLSLFVDLKNAIPTGISSMDIDLKGGIPRKAITTILAEPNVGKTTFCISLGANAIKYGQKVLHVNLDATIKSEELNNRYLSNLSGVPLNNIQKGTLSVEQRNKIEKVSGILSKNFKIRHITGFDLMGHDLWLYLEALYKDYKFDVLIIDHAQLLHHDKKHQSQIGGLFDTYTILSIIARNLDCAVVSPAVPSKNSKKLSNNDYVISVEDIPEFYGVSMVSSVIVSLNKSDKEGRIRAFLAKNRMGIKNTYSLIPDYATNDFTKQEP